MSTSRAAPPARRQQAIADHLFTHNTSTAQELAELFGVSLVTMHRDLDALARKRVVRKFHGGVTAQPSTAFESSVEFRISHARKEKQSIARLAAQYVEPGMSVLLDNSTTNLHLLEHLEEIRPLTLITNFVPIITTASQWSDVVLVVLGGEYNSRLASLLGVDCQAAAGRIRADIGFFSFTGIDAGGMYHQEQDVVACKQAMLASSGRRIALADHSKLGRTALHWAAPLTDFEQLITDSGAPKRVLRELREYQARVTVCPDGPEQDQVPSGLATDHRTHRQRTGPPGA